MYYVQATHNYYPSGGFDDIKFKGTYADCCYVVELLREKGHYDHVYVCQDIHVSTLISDFE